MLFYDLGQCQRMPPYRFVAGFDDGFEAQRRRYSSLSPRFPGVCLPGWELAHREPEKFEPDVPVVGGEGMRNLRFAWLQFQPHARLSTPLLVAAPVG